MTVTAAVAADVAALHRRAGERFGALVAAVPDDAWTKPTPCAGWSVRDLVDHVVVENLWTPPLLEGKTIAEVGDAFEGDQLGDDPAGAWTRAWTATRNVVDEPGALAGTAHLSFGDVPATEYVWQLFADHLIHGWDLAEAIGSDSTLEDDLVAACTTWFDSVEELYRSAGAVAARPLLPDGADAQARLLARFGRSDTSSVVQRFLDAFNAHDLDTAMALMTDDCVFDSTAPAPDGTRHEGQEAVRAAFEQVLADTPGAHFEDEELVIAGDRAVARWKYDFGHGHVRGIDLLHIRAGKVAAKLSYVKG